MMAEEMGRLMNAARSDSPDIETEAVGETLVELSAHAILARMLLEESAGNKPQESGPRRGRRPGQKEKKDAPVEAGDALPGDTAAPLSQE